MNVACIDFEGVLVPEIWISLAERTGIDDLKLTTRDIPDYDELMGHRLGIMDKRGLRYKELLAAATDQAIGKDQGIIPLHYQVNTWAGRKPWKYTPRTDERTVAMEVHQ